MMSEEIKKEVASPSRKKLTGANVWLQEKAQAAAKELASVQGQIAKIDDELYWLENSPLPLSDALKNIGAFVDEKGNVDGIEHFFFSREIAGPGVFDARVHFNGDNQLHVIPETNVVVGAGSVNLENIFCALFPKDVKQQLTAMAKAAADGIESGPPLDERAGLKGDLLKRRHKLEVEEESIISTAEELGLTGFYRRSDCNPKIVLMMPQDQHNQ